jgi:glycosyltransferase involved in cell wall biosynthesis
MRILVFSDIPVPSGFGRISTYIARFLHYRGHDVRAAGLYYNGDPHSLPFHVFPLVGQDIWGRLTQIINFGVGDGWTPDLVIASQDFPYLVSLFRDCPIDWSNKKAIGITPIDGTPVFKEWEAVAKVADGMMVISRFGVEAMRQQGVQADLAHPGVDTAEFWPATPEEYAALRAKAGIDSNHWIYGMFAMNQGRKAIPDTMRGWWEFARDKPNAMLYLDMDETSPAGWNLPALAQSMGVPTERMFLREHLSPHLPSIRDRMAILDAHGVLSYREGFGLPLLESMACRIPTFAQDWCSGTEVVSEGRGYLVNVLRDQYGNRVMTPGTWGNAQDAIPDSRHFAELLNECYGKPTEAAAIAERGYQWAIQQTWEACGAAVERIISRIFGPAALNRHSRVQPNGGPGSDAGGLRGLAGGDLRPVPNGDHPDRRLQPSPAGIVPDQEALSAGQGGAVGQEHGLRPEQQQGQPGWHSAVVTVPKLGHGSRAGVAGEPVDSNGATPKRRSRAEADLPDRS